MHGSQSGRGGQVREWRGRVSSHSWLGTHTHTHTQAGVGHTQNPGSSADVFLNVATQDMFIMIYMLLKHNSVKSVFSEGQYVFLKGQSTQITKDSQH